MLAKLNMSANFEVGPISAMVGAACGVGKEEWASDSGATFHMCLTHVGMVA